jgi:ATP-dependent exoDNAse (exonuclease V) alpha subunit
MFGVLDRVVLTTAVPALGLEAGDIGTVVLIHEGGKGFEVEFVKLDGETYAVTTLRSDQVRPIDRNEIAHARVLVS